MTLKINRRVFILSTLGYVYYVKLDDGIIIKRLEVVLNSVNNNSNGNMEMCNMSKGTKGNNNSYIKDSNKPVKSQQLSSPSNKPTSSALFK